MKSKVTIATIKKTCIHRDEFVLDIFGISYFYLS